ncbi:MAG: hypothetical protein RIC55_28995 [Pirellulaceae bacterium]
MPIKFPCESCGQVLSVGSRKVGRRAKCPKCSEPLLVPAAEDAAEMMRQRRRRREDVDSEDFDPFSEFAVYDDEMEVVYESDDEPGESLGQVDRNLVAVPRAALYTQGVVLGVVGLVCFALGVIVGGGFASHDGQAQAAPRPCVIDGTVAFVGSTDREIPDQGALVLVLPKDRSPEQRPDPEGMRPADAPPAEDHPGLQMVRSIAGGYARTDIDGRFRIRVPDVGEYYVLVVSSSAQRPGEDVVKRNDLAEIGNYFVPAYELLGDMRYQWEEHRIRADETMRVVFR